MDPRNLPPTDPPAIPEPDREERADHEAGHYVVARALNLDCRPFYLTIEERENSGGLCHLLPKGPIPVWQQVQYLLGGVLTESAGKLVRRYGTDLPSEEILKVECEQVVTRAIQEGGHGDLVEVLALLKKTTAVERCDPVEEFRKVKALMFREPWRVEWQLLSKILQRDTTLFGGEANLIFKLTEDEKFLRFYHVYKRYRRRVPPPRSWYDYASPRYPAGPWYEDTTTFFERALQRNGETEEQRDARLAIDMDV
jgi:hypothetical protein